MPLQNRTTLTQFLIEERRRHPQASGDFNSLLLNVALACKRIARAVAFGALGAQRQEAVGKEAFLELNEWSGALAGMLADGMDAPYRIPAAYPKGKYLLVFDPLGGASHIDVDVSVGSLFSVLRAPDGNRAATLQDFLQAGSEQAAAGYALYGPATMLVLTVGTGVNGFTLDPDLGEFILTHPALQIPPDTQEFAIDAANSRFWEAPVKRYVDECLAGKSGARDKDFHLRWIASMAAEAHRILMHGGVFLYPRDTRSPEKSGRPHLLYHANPIGLLVEQAGGRASTGREPVLGVMPSSPHQRTGLVFGARNEVERIERYHAHPEQREIDNPLFNERGLFRLPA